MKIVFIGSVLFSYAVLEKLISMREEVVAVFTPKESPFNADFVSLEPLCIANNIPIYFFKSINEEENIKILKKIKPDIIYCFGFSQLLKKEVISIPRIGTIGFHPAKLPQNRGRHPIIWALFLGLKSTASTFFFMDEGIDSGDIISQVEIPIYYEDDAYSLYQRITKVALQQIEELTEDLKKGIIRRIKQNHSLSNYWRKRSKIDGQIDFRMSSYAIYNLVRALTKPYAGAHLMYKNKEVKVWKVREEAINSPNIEPGKVLEVNPLDRTILVKAYDNGIRILEHEFETLPEVGEYL